MVAGLYTVCKFSEINFYKYKLYKNTLKRTKNEFFCSLFCCREGVKMVKEKSYLINEAAKEVHVESHVLRYWEEELELPIMRNEQGHRIYSQEDVDKFIKIKALKDQGLQLKAVKAVLDKKNNVSEDKEDVKADNPFAQKQYTKISKITDDADKKVVCIKTPEDIRWKEAFEDKYKAKKELAIQIRKVKSLNKAENETELAGEKIKIDENDKQKQQMERLQFLFQKLIQDSVANSISEVLESTFAEKISDILRQDMIKELDYQFRLAEERVDMFTKIC